MTTQSAAWQRSGHCKLQYEATCACGYLLQMEEIQECEGKDCRMAECAWCSYCDVEIPLTWITHSEMCVAEHEATEVYYEAMRNIRR